MPYLDYKKKQQEDEHNVITLNFLQHLNTAHSYHNYNHLAYSFCKHKLKQQIQTKTKPQRERLSKMAKWELTIATKPPKNLRQCQTKYSKYTSYGADKVHKTHPKAITTEIIQSYSIQITS